MEIAIVLFGIIIGLLITLIVCLFIMPFISFICFCFLFIIGIIMDGQGSEEYDNVHYWWRD